MSKLYMVFAAAVLATGTIAGLAGASPNPGKSPGVSAHCDTAPNGSLDDEGPGWTFDHGATTEAECSPSRATRGPRQDDPGEAALHRRVRHDWKVDGVYVATHARG